MRRVLGLLTLVLLTLPVGLGARQMTTIPVRDTTLANGFQVIVAEDHRIPMFTAMLAVRAGASTQKPEARGIAHVFEHILFRTFGRDPWDFAEEVAKRNGAYNGTTSTDVVTYYVIAPSPGTHETIGLLADLLRQTNFDEDDLREELPIILDEMARVDDQPDLALRRRMAPRLWGDEWHRFDVLGDSASLAGLTLEGVRSHLKRFYVPSNAALIVTGDANAQSVFQQAAERLGDWDAPDAMVFPPTGPGTPHIPATSLVLLAADVTDATINISLLGPGVADDPGSVRALKDVARILSEPALPFQAQLVSNGPFQQLSVSVSSNRDASVVEFEGSLNPSQAVAGVRALLWSLNNVSSFLVVDTNQLIGTGRLAELRSTLLLERTSVVAPILAENWSAGRPLGHIWEGELTSLDEMQAAARTFLSKKPMVVGVLGPPEAVESVQGALGPAKSR